MTDLYLNDTKKEFYSNALEYAKNCDEPYWRVEPEVVKYLDQINSSLNVRTMYHKFFKGHISYLMVCFTENVEDQVKSNCMQKLKECFVNKRFCMIDAFPQPQRIQPASENYPPCHKYLSDTNYWNINHIKFEFKGDIPDDHKLFWSTLTDYLSKL